MANEHRIDANKVNFECGCQFDLLGYRKDGTPRIKFNPNVAEPGHDVNFNCQSTFDIMCKGLTKGVFQIEKPLGRQIVKQLLPQNMGDVFALGSILRPGATQNRDENGVSAAEHYCLQRNGLEELTVVPDAIKDIVGSTYNQVIYQEQAMAIAAKVAAFDLIEVDRLRRAAGKKSSEEMSVLEKLFLERAESLGIISIEEAKTVFRGIKASQRYSFNASHATGYGITTYITAFCKAHFCLEFFLKKLQLAQDEQNPLEEIDKFIEDAKLFNINVLPPDLRKMNETFWSDRKDIYFGLTDIKGIGQSQFKKLEQMPTDRWIDFLLTSKKLSSTVVDALIRSGALSHFDLHRKQMLEEYRVYQGAIKSAVSSRIIEKIIEESPPDNLIDLLETALPLLPVKKTYNNVVIKRSKKRRYSIWKNVEIRSALYEKISSDLKLLKNPPSSLEDTHSQTVSWELDLLGVAISQGRIKMSDESLANCSIKDILTGIIRSPIIVAQILSVKMLVTKRGNNPGQKMASVVLEDNSGKISCPVFPVEFEKYENLIVTGSILAFSLDRLRDGGYNIKKIWELQ